MIMKILFILLLVFLLLRLIFKPVLRLVITSVLSKMAQQGGAFNQKAYRYTAQTKKRPDGSIVVEDPNIKNNAKNPASDAGEYIDFEEIK